MKLVGIILVFVFVLAMPFVVAEENETLSDFFKEKIENKTGAPILEDTNQTVFTFEEVIGYAVYLVVGLLVLVGIWIIYSLLRKRKIRDRQEDNIK